jgi:hypothetical protein
MPPLYAAATRHDGGKPLCGALYIVAEREEEGGGDDRQQHC